MKLSDLSEILKYQNKYVIDRYCKEYNSTFEEAQLLFVDLLKYLWLSKKNNLELKNSPHINAHVAMYPEMLNLDNMWHTFILFTRDYTAFGEKYFGHYIHHQPHTEEDSIPSTEEFEQQFCAFLSYVYDHLGEEILKRWFPNYC